MDTSQGKISFARSIPGDIARFLPLPKALFPFVNDIGRFER